ncbi:MAG: exodeoxyribonuclease VII small subunit [Candidatus Poseidoniaceae archaeon]|jgi:exodeoxyribonuclease VII small subunit|nr:exodeoxyribonuclease VII small subunit [Euryarchaeota archaeon]MDP6234436.1 exodeoxyribonuclease VII small subunit [Candidatus Poseidoniaceae archaeon]|tara:strand:- start:150 stop:386 length:237 start_codon:yes stop_codon:yes gene_type:complete
MSDEIPTYSDAVQRLETIVSTLERGGMGLDETLKLYEEGAELLKLCKKELAAAEGKLNEMQLDELESELGSETNDSNA